ncbi:dihydrolipoyllysine residue succinyltransferase [Trichuris trichiura]|uniref:Dihydrolipoyllysine-residue succinyltransferase component of 2-oxoglutarate dehydrogenase complex, mitochondrial n=1 Tax=Trichuris trichiura TaxID=36087 RepID=A0A077YXC6_TRITR|nr:dihydrolipoyllysine residue succinyltransferase [Trichuris trichiura]
MERLFSRQRRVSEIAAALQLSIFFNHLLSGQDVIDVEGPTFAESITEGDIRWLKQKGEFVKADELVAEIETDKTTVEVPAPHSGVLEELLVSDGDRVAAKQLLYRLRLTSMLMKGSSEIAESQVGMQKLIPKKRRKSKSRNSSGSEEDRKAYSTEITGDRTEYRVKINRLRARVAQRLKDSQNTYAMLTTFNEVDMSAVVSMRKKYNDAFQKRYGVKLGFMSPFVKAATYALQDQPIVNAVIDEGEIVYRQFIDISVAVASPRGLVVPVLRNVESMSTWAIFLFFELVHYFFQAKINKLPIEDMEGGTFTISNGGVFGSLFGTPIINPPQSAILGIHAIVDKPAAVDGKIEIRPMMYICLTYDHRLIDGREAVTFLRTIKRAIENPAIMLLGL